MGTIWLTASSNCWTLALALADSATVLLVNSRALWVCAESCSIDFASSSAAFATELTLVCVSMTMPAVDCDLSRVCAAISDMASALVCIAPTASVSSLAMCWTDFSNSAASSCIAARAFGHAILLGLVGGLLHRADFDHVLAKYVDGFDHLADLIAAIAMADFDVGLAGG